MWEEFLRTAQSVISRYSTEEDDISIQDFLMQFRERRPLYEEFCAVMYKILDSLLREKGYKYQIVYRIKSSERLAEKLARKKKEGKLYKALTDVEDLAGLRVIFYSENDKDAFIRDLEDELAGTFRLEQKRKGRGYEAIHIIAQLGHKRVRLVEYKRFAELKCEIQLTSILRHAWAEIEHDFTYKDINSMELKDPERYKTIQAKLQEILEKYIKKASSEFEEVIQETKDSI